MKYFQRDAAKDYPKANQADDVAPSRNAKGLFY